MPLFPADIYAVAPIDSGLVQLLCKYMSYTGAPWTAILPPSKKYTKRVADLIRAQHAPASYVRVSSACQSL